MSCLPDEQVDDDPEHTIQLDVSTAPVVVTVSEVRPLYP